MTKEHRVTFTLADVRAIHLRCAKCQGRIVHAPTKMAVPLQCPLCGTSWLRVVSDADQMVTLINAIKASLQPMPHDPPLVDVLFELDDCGGD